MTVLGKSNNGFWYIPAIYTLNSGVVHPQLIHIRFPMDGTMDDGSHLSTPSKRLPLIIPSHTWKENANHIFLLWLSIEWVWSCWRIIYLFILFYLWHSHERKDGIFWNIPIDSLHTQKTFWKNLFFPIFKNNIPIVPRLVRH